MTRQRRPKGEGGLHWDAARNRWIATAHLGFDGTGRRIVKRGSGRTKTEAREKLKAVLRDFDDGLAIAPHDYTVGHAVQDWLAYGLNGRDESTITTNRILCETHVTPLLGALKVRDLSAEDVDKWLAGLAPKLSTRTLQAIHSCLNRAIKRAMARDKVKRNVVALCSVPQGRVGRPSKSLTMAQAEGVLKAVETHRMRAYLVLSLLTGARTEELRALKWTEVNLTGQAGLGVPVPPHVAVWRSVRTGGDTKTRKSRRTIALPHRCVEALKWQREWQARCRESAGVGWIETGLVFTSNVGTPLDAAHVRRDFRLAIKNVEGIDPAAWTPRELRHSFVSLLSDSGVALEEISRLVGHSTTATTEEVYRHQIRPVIQTGAVVMDQLFARRDQIS